MENTNNKAGGSRSTFVSVVAWIFIAISAFATLVALLENVVVNMVFHAGAFPPLPAGTDQQIPPMAMFMFHNMRWLALGFLLISVVSLIAAIGLLLRKEWGRRLFIVVMVGAIVWNIGGLVFQSMFLSGMAATPPMPAMPGNVPGDFAQGFEVFSTVMRIFSAVVALAICVLYGWIIKRLVSPKIRAEFA